MAAPWPRKLPFRWVLVGTLVPDLVDKPAFFLLGVYHHFHDGGWVPGKRGFAHTLLFLGLLSALLAAKRSPKLQAVSFGVATHLLLDVISKMTGVLHWSRDVFVVLCWPLLGFTFPVLPYGMHGVVALAFEVVGAVLLVAQVLVQAKRRRSGAAT